MRSYDDTYYVDDINDIIWDVVDNGSIYDFAGNDTVYISVSGYSVPYSIENVIYLQGAQPLPYFIDALYAGWHQGDIGQAQSITYSFATVAEGTTGFALYTPEQQTAVRTALAKYSDIADLTFTEITDSTDVQIRFFRDDLTSAGYGNASGYGGGGSVHIRSDLTDLSPNPTGLTGLFSLLLHEIGHALDLKHPGNYDVTAGGANGPYLPSNEDDMNNTVMSYMGGGYPIIDLATFDKAAIHYLYGVNPTAKTGDDTYHISDRYIWDGAGIDTLSAAEQTQSVYLNLIAGNWIYAGAKNDSILADNQAFIGFGTAIENAIGGSGNDVIEGNALANVLQGGDGRDTVSYNGTSAEVTVNLGLTTAQDTKGAGMDTISGFENLTGSYYNDTLLGNALANILRGNDGADNISGDLGNDKLLGGFGKDILIGGLGKDHLIGSFGADKFKFTSVTETGIKTTTRDIITDFKHNQGDKIDLSVIDANTTVTDNNAFTAITAGGASFCVNHPGILHFDSATHILYGNNDNDSAADFSILLTGITSLTARDFVL